MNRKVMGGMVGILLATLACGVISPPAAPNQQAGVETIVAATMQALTVAAPATVNEAPPVGITPTEPAQPSGIPVSFQNVSFIIPDGLGTGANPEAIPAVGENDGGPWDVAPAHSKFTLVGYPLQGKFFEPHILVYPAQEFESANSAAAYSLEKLRATLANPSGPLTKDSVPGVPTFNAAMVFASNIQVLNSQHSAGVRALTEYAQYYAPINNREMIYQFQGLTNDGKYYIIAILPVTAPFLVADENPASPVPADGIAMPDINTTTDETVFIAYYQAVTDKLNSTGPGSFAPTLDQLDTLIQSINISP